MKHYKIITEVYLLMNMVIFISCRNDLKLQPIQIIPEPVATTPLHLSPFVVDDHSIIYITDTTMIPPAERLLSSLNEDYKIDLIDSSVIIHGGISLRYSSDATVRTGGYTLDIHTQSIVINAYDTPGLWHGVQTLSQLLPPDPEMINHASLPALRIEDFPRFDWRGMHLDVSRHFMPVEFVKKYIDLLSYHKLNVFHWHLVDGIGWRIEIKSHPELTDIGAWRVVKEGKKPWEDFEVWKEGDSRPKYGGYYTQEEIREVVEYASKKEITVLPEIELPGHSEVVMQCYPELQCIDEKGKHLPNIGVYCANLEESYTLLEEVLLEVMELFPSEYIHIGGDEVNKSNWKQCIRDQALMQQRNYSLEEVQSHFVNHFDRFLREHGRKLMGWHEILEGELSSSASIMYWGGPDGVTDMLEKGHPAVLTTGNRYYFDHYQSTSMHEPEAFGGLSTLTQVYTYEPVPAEIEKKYGDFILGIQANAWSEYLEDSDQVEYMVFPRIAAMAESAWSPASKKNWQAFTQKVPRLMAYYRHHDVNYAPSAYRPLINATLEESSDGLLVHLNPELSSQLFYTTDGSIPSMETGTPYTSPFPVSKTAVITANAFQHDQPLVEPEVKKVIVHLALGEEVELSEKPYSDYAAQGGTTLVDGQFGGNNWGNGKWLGYLDQNFSTTIRFGTEQEIKSVGYSAIEDQPSGIYFPDEISVLVSEDNQRYEEVAVMPIEHSSIHYDTKTKDSIFQLKFPPVNASFLRVEASCPRIPDKGVFLFVDEIVVE